MIELARMQAEADATRKVARLLPKRDPERARLEAYADRLEAKIACAVETRKLAKAIEAHRAKGVWSRWLKAAEIDACKAADLADLTPAEAAHNAMVALGRIRPPGQ